MLWSLISSAYIIYLYRKLNAEQDSQLTTGHVEGGSGGQDAELAKLNDQISSLEEKLAGNEKQEASL